MEVATVVDKRGDYYRFTFTCSKCGWKVNLHRTDPPHFEHQTENPKFCAFL